MKLRFLNFLISCMDSGLMAGCRPAVGSIWCGTCSCVRNIQLWLFSPVASTEGPYLSRCTAMLEWESRGVVRDERSGIRRNAGENKSGYELLIT